MNLKMLKTGDVISFRDEVAVVEFIEYIAGNTLVHLMTTTNNGQIYRYAQWLKLDDHNTIWYGTPQQNHWIKSGGHLLCRA